MNAAKHEEELVAVVHLNPLSDFIHCIHWRRIAFVAVAILHHFENALRAVSVDLIMKCFS